MMAPMNAVRVLYHGRSSSSQNSSFVPANALPPCDVRADGPSWPGTQNAELPPAGPPDSGRVERSTMSGSCESGTGAYCVGWW